MDPELQKQIKRGEKFFLDLTTGFIMGATPVIENDPRYKGRFIPWTAPIPAGGRVDLEAYQRKVAADMAELTANMAAAMSAVTPGTATPGVVVPDIPVVPPAGAAAIAEGTEVPLTPGQRMDKILAVISALKTDEMTGGGFPKVSALSDLCGFDVEGSERDTAWAEFAKTNPDWKPQE